MSISFQSSPKKVFFSNIDGLKAIAFFFVFIPHTLYRLFPYLESDNIIFKTITKSILDLWNGVPLFFTISGFLITFKCLKEIKNKGTIDVKKFHLHRITRIWPLYFLVLIFSFYAYPFFVTLFQHPVSYCSKPIFYFLFLSNFDVIRIFSTCSGHHTPFTLATWYIAAQEQFYFFFPTLLLLIPRNFYQIFFLILVGLGVLIRYIYIQEELTAYYHTLNAASDIATGALAAFLIFSDRHFNVFIYKLSKNIIYFTFASGLIFIISNILFTYNIYSDVLRKVILAFFNAFIILILTHNKHGQKFIFKPTFFYKIGKYSYGLYLLHLIILTLFEQLFKLFNINIYLPIVTLAIAFLTFLLSFFLSYFSYNYFEVYFLKLRRLIT